MSHGGILKTPTRPVVLVTGAARRLGRAMAMELAAHGYDVAVHYRHSAQDAQATADAAVQVGARAKTFAADLSDPADLQALLPKVIAAMGQVDALVNNASHFAYDSADTFKAELLETMMRANCTPAAVLMQGLHAHLQARSSATRQPVQGSVVNVLDHKLAHPNPDYFSYTASKAALACVSFMAAQAFAPTLRVNSVSPGLTLGSELIDEARLTQLQQRAPLGRGTAPQDVASAVRYLLASPAITGTNLVVDAGSHLRPTPRDVAFG